MFLSNSENMWNVSFKASCFWRASGKMVVITQSPDLITAMGEHKNKGRRAGEGPSEVPSSLEISREESQGGLHSLKQGKNQGTDGRRPDFSSRLGQRPGSHCILQSPGSRRLGSACTGAAVMDWTAPSRRSWKRMAPNGRRDLSAGSESTSCCDTQPLGGNTAGPSTGTW